MKILTSLTLLTALAMGLVACSSDNKRSTQVSSQSQEVTTMDVTSKTPPASASLVDPLKEGQMAPSATLQRPDGKEVDMARLYARKPSVLIFYRGGWCPYCNTQLGKIAEAEKELVKLGFQVVAISPDRPSELKTTLDKGDYEYQLLSDSNMDLTKAYGLAFRVDKLTIEKYHNYDIDLEKASGQSHHLLPVPAVYIVDRKGVIRFVHWNPDYKTRLSNEDLLAAAHKVMGK